MISGFYPLKYELNVIPILEELYKKSYEVCLPVIVEKDSPLIFKSWKPEDKLVKSKFFNVLEPSEE